MSRRLRPIDVLQGATLPFGDANDPRRKRGQAKYAATLDWQGEIKLSDYANLPYMGDLNEAAYAGSEKERAIEESILAGSAFDDPKELPIIEIERGHPGISQGNHRTYSLRKLRNEGKIGDILVPMRIIYYGNEDLKASSWYPRSLAYRTSQMKTKLLR